MTVAEPTAEPADPLAPDALPIGTPLAWPVVDRDGTLLLERGAVLVGEPERDFLFAHFAPYRGDLELSEAPAPGESGPAAAYAPPGVREMSLAPGALMGLRTQTAGNGAPMHPCRLIGFAPNEMLFVTLPYVDGRMMPLNPGENVDVVAIASQTVYRFVCSAVAIHQTPFDYLVLSKPGAVRRRRERQSIRVRARLPVRFKLGAAAGPAGGVALAREVSARGLSVVAPWALGQVGERLHVAFELRTGGVETAIETSAIIRNVQHEAGSDAPATLGLELDELTPASQMAMKAYVFDRQDDLQQWAHTLR